MKYRVNYGVQSQDGNNYTPFGHRYLEANTLTDAKRKATLIVSQSYSVIDWVNYHNYKHGWDKEKPSFKPWHPDKIEQEKYNDGTPYYVNESGVNYVRRFSELDYSRKEFVTIYLVWKGDID